MATEVPAHTTGTVVPAEEHQGPGAFPPFEPANFAPQLVWLALTFGALYLLMSRIALPRVAGILEMRKARIAKDISDAQGMQSEATAAGAAYDKTLADAKASAQAMAQATRDDLARVADAKRHGVEADLNAKLADAEAQIGATKAGAMANVDTIAREAAATIVEHITGRSPDADAVARAVAAARG